MEAAELRNRYLQMTSSRLRPFVSAWVSWLPWLVGPLMGLVSLFVSLTLWFSQAEGFRGVGFAMTFV